MGIVLWYSPLPDSNFNTQFNYLVSAINTLVPANGMNITYNEFDDYTSKSKEKTFNECGFDILPCHMTLVKNIPDDERVFKKLMTLILTLLHTDCDEQFSNTNKYTRIQLDENKISFDSNNFFKNCVLEVDKVSISVLLSMIQIITSNINEIPDVDIDAFQPHISLCYSKNNISENKSLQASIAKRVDMYLELQDKKLDWAVGMGSLYNKTKIGRFYLVRCEGTMDTWTILKAMDI